MLGTATCRTNLPIRLVLSPTLVYPKPRGFVNHGTIAVISRDHHDAITTPSWHQRSATTEPSQHCCCVNIVAQNRRRLCSIAAEPRYYKGTMDPPSRHQHRDYDGTSTTMCRAEPQHHRSFEAQKRCQNCGIVSFSSDRRPRTLCIALFSSKH
jgi:hypothetical protein